jgi:hypothetical protein
MLLLPLPFSGYLSMTSGDPSKPPSSGGPPLSKRLTAIAQELAKNPDSPASLAIMSSVNRAMRPRQQASEQLVAALAERLQRPEDPQCQAGVDAAISYWERTCEAPLGGHLLAEFEESARNLLRQRAQQPPPLESIVAGVDGRSDVGYQLGVDLNGLRGTWHRLWALIAMEVSFSIADGLANPVAAAAMSPAVKTVRDQFEQQLGRALSEQEWCQLVNHAQARGLAMRAGE